MKGKQTILILSLLLLLTGCQTSNSKHDTGDGVVPPSIFVNGSLYGPHQSKRNQTELNDDFIYYGTVKSVVKHKYEVPTEELQVSNLLDHCIGYKVYISGDNDEIAMFIESLNSYTFFD